MLTALHALILGIVEGFTEFLPISSTAHLNLAADLLHLSQSEYVKTFEIAIQSGAILAVLALYWRRFLDWGILKKVVVAFIPTGILGLAFYSFIKTYLIGNTFVALAAPAARTRTGRWSGHGCIPTLERGNDHGAGARLELNLDWV